MVRVGWCIVRLDSTVVGRGACAAHARRRRTQCGNAYYARRTVAVTAARRSLHAASTLPARLASATVFGVARAAASSPNRDVAGRAAARADAHEGSRSRPPVRSASVVKQRDVCGCRWPHARGARHGQGRHSAGAMPEPRRASKRARRACRGMPEPAWWSPDAGYVQGRLRLRSCRQTAPRAKFAGGIEKHPGLTFG